MNIKRPNITPGDWQEYTMQSSSGLTIRGRFVQVVHYDSVSRVAEIPSENPEDQQAISAIPQLLAALEKAYERSCERAECWNPATNEDGDETEYAGFCSDRDEYKAALLAAGYTEPKEAL
jgi:hypothetical protein